MTDDKPPSYQPDPAANWGECFDCVALKFFDLCGISLNGYRDKLGVKLKDLNGKYGDTEQKKFVGFVNKHMRDRGYFGPTGQITKADATKNTKLGAVRQAVRDQVRSELLGKETDEEELPPPIAP